MHPSRPRSDEWSLTEKASVHKSSQFDGAKYTLSDTV
jgi:hypothetical protein